MAKYVDVEKVFCAICEDKDRCGSPDLFCDVHSMPAEDVVPVGRGKWERFHLGAYDFAMRLRCSNCSHIVYEEGYNFCPNCGKYMREEGDNE